MRTTKLVRFGLPLLMSPLLAAGCLIGSSSDDGDDDADDTGQPADTSSDTTPADSSDDDSGSADSVGTSTSTPTGECSESRIVDGGFEAGTPSSVWTEASEQFGTPICDIGCTEDEGAVPYEGTWFAWFGGLAEPEVASVEQTVTIDGETAYLSFRFEINAAAGTADDTFDVTIDGESVFMVTDSDVDRFDAYTPVSIDVSEYADGGDHVVRFEATFPGTGLSNFFLDTVELITCVEGVGSSSSGTGSSESTASDSGSSGSSGADTSSSSDGSSDSGSSSSDGSSSSSGT
ncbi:MAG: hypothetical protein IAG13_33235 [Deltaproteobacteria bacterium]|nr:hypothetical protein [Nannocystaceae bacterium]